MRPFDLRFSPSPPEWRGWTVEFDALAWRDGWSIMGDISPYIVRVDHPKEWPYWTEGDYVRPIFTCDDEAIAFVISQAKLGVRHAIHALQINVDWVGFEVQWRQLLDSGILR